MLKVPVHEKCEDELVEKIKFEQDRADRAEIEAQIAWEVAERMREVAVVALRGYNDIRMFESENSLENEVARRLAIKKIKKK